MRCLLISSLDTHQKGTKALLTPLSLPYLAGTLLEKGHKVEIFQRELAFINLRFNLDQVNKNMIEFAKGFNPEIIGFSATSATIGDLLTSAKLLRKYFPDAILICGGPHVSALPLETLKQAPYLDIVVIGDGEEPLAEICAGSDYSQIKGIAYQTVQGPVETEKPARKSNLDFLPYPARHLIDMKFHTSSSPAVIPNLSMRTTTVVSSRGCPFACTYCAESRQKVGMRWHSPDYLMGEIEHLLSYYDFEGLYFIDSMFEYNRKRAEELCQLMIKSKLNKKLVWSVQSRATSMDEDLLKLMKEAGCVQIEYGFESGSQRILDLVGKKASVEAGVKAAHLTKKTGIRVFANMIFGFPRETEEDFDKSVEFIKRINPDAIGAYQLEAYPGTALYEQLLREERLPLNYNSPDIDWAKVEIQRKIRHMNLSSMSDEVFAKKMDALKREIVGPLTTADLLKNMKKSSLNIRTIGKIPYKVLTNPLRAAKVVKRLVKK